MLTLGSSLEEAMLWFEVPGRDVAVIVNSAAFMHPVGIVTESHLLKRYAQELERRRVH